jgi:tRNA dimethylallyltransferase
MLKSGAIDEVRSLLSCLGNDRGVTLTDYNIAKKYPVFNAIGAKEVVMYLSGVCSYDTMVNLIKLNTRHYAKRQMTWFRHQVQESEFLKISLLQH